MYVILGGARRGPVVAIGAIVSALLLLTVTVARGVPATTSTLLLSLVVLLALTRDALFRWRTLFFLLLFVILFIPIGRYQLPGHLPLSLEPYRLLVALILAAWVASLLIDRHVKLRASGLDAPIALIAVASLCSILVNGGRIDGLNVGTEVVKTASFLISYFLVFYFVVSVVRSLADVETAVRILVGGGAVIALLAAIEKRTGFNPFLHFSVIPGFVPNGPQEIVTRFGAIRATGPAQHPIALGAVLELLLPLALYLALTTRKAYWWVAAALLPIGANASVSRTPVVMLVLSAITILVMRPRQAIRFWPALVPALVLIHFAVPGTLGSLKAQFLPKGGLVAEQQVHPQSTSSAGRLADVDPSIDEVSPKPLFGQGLGTRVTTGPNANARLLDDEWLARLVEVGVAGLLGWIWLIVRFVRRSARAAKNDFTQRGWLLVALVCSVVSFAGGMFLFDAFSFVQVSFVFFILLALGSVTFLQPAPVEQKMSAV